MVSIAGLDRVEVLMALYNASRPQGMGFMHYDPKPMSREDGERLLAKTKYFDYLQGRVMKVMIDGDEIDERLYDRDNGRGSVARVIESLRKTMDAANDAVRMQHAIGVAEGACIARDGMNEKTRSEPGLVTLGLDEVKGMLEPKIKKALGE